MTKKIKKCQYWIVENGSVAFVTTKGAGRNWFVNLIESEGCFSENFEMTDDEDFKTRISKTVAKSIAINYVKKRIKRILNI
ncbi:hypothetical protein KAI52_02805 [Candidatus Parcubacteria bacterium]|nr:hypothetical protein [Candidatus Parcubacteria bacterium]